MAQDDLHVVMYKILAYLYSCLKSGEEPKREHYWNDGDVLDIPYAYWAQIMRDMDERGYIRGFVFIDEWGGGTIVKAANPGITMEGVEFLQENSLMQKALRFLKETKSALPFI